jgi:hypothetical protein
MKKILLIFLAVGLVASVSYGITATEVKNAVVSAAKSAAAAARRFATAAKKHATTFATYVKNKATSAKESISSAYQKAKTSASNLSTSLKAKLPTKAGLSASLDKFKISASSLKTKIGTGFTTAKEKIGSGLSTAKTKIGSGLSKIKSSLTQAYRSETGKTIREGAGAVAGEVGKIIVPVVTENLRRSLSEAVTNATLGVTQAIDSGTRSALQAVGLNPNASGNTQVVLAPEQQEIVEQKVEENLAKVEQTFEQQLVDADVNATLAHLLAEDLLAKNLTTVLEQDVIDFLETFNAISALYLPEGGDKFSDLALEDQKNLLHMAEIFVGAAATTALTGADMVKVMQSIVPILISALEEGNMIESAGLIKVAGDLLEEATAAEGQTTESALGQSEEALSDDSLAELGEPAG